MPARKLVHATATPMPSSRKQMLERRTCQTSLVGSSAADEGLLPPSAGAGCAAAPLPQSEAAVLLVAVLPK